MDLHKASARRSQEEAIAGITTGIMGPNDVVTWRAKHFGLRLKHSAEIVRYDPPRFFYDRMTAGVFRTFEHNHSFLDTGTRTTLMLDELRFASPCGWLGAVVDRSVLRSYLTKFLERRNELLREVAESNGWTDFVPEIQRASCV